MYCCHFYMYIYKRYIKEVHVEFNYNRRLAQDLIKQFTNAYNQQPVCWNIRNNVWSDKRREFMYNVIKHNAICFNSQIFLCIAGNADKQSLTQHAFPHLSEHQTSFQAFCRFVNYTVNIYKSREVLLQQFCLKVQPRLDSLALS